MNTYEQTTLLNPFSVSLNASNFGNRSPFQRVSKKPLLDYRGVMVHQIASGHWCYSQDRVILTERAGFKPEKARDIIDDYRDGTNKSCTTNYHAYERKRKAYTNGLAASKTPELSPEFNA